MPTERILQAKGQSLVAYVREQTSQSQAGPGQDFFDLGPFELMLLAIDKGWKQFTRSGSGSEANSRCPPYSAGAQKWFAVAKETDCNPWFLQCLSLADDLLQHGLTALHWFQPVAYYKLLAQYMRNLPDMIAKGMRLSFACPGLAAKQYKLDLLSAVAAGANSSQPRGRGQQQLRADETPGLHGAGDLDEDEPSLSLSFHGETA